MSLRSLIYIFNEVGRKKEKERKKERELPAKVEVNRKFHHKTWTLRWWKIDCQRWNRLSSTMCFFIYTFLMHT